MKDSHSASRPVAFSRRALPAWLSANVHNCLPCITLPSQVEPLQTSDILIPSKNPWQIFISTQHDFKSRLFWNAISKPFYILFIIVRIVKHTRSSYNSLLKIITSCPHSKGPNCASTRLPRFSMAIPCPDFIDCLFFQGEYSR